MGFLRARVRWFAAAATLAALAFACSLNPQPLPPLTDDGGMNGSPGTHDASANLDGATFSDAGGDAGGMTPDGSNATDAAGDAPEPRMDGGDAGDAGDASDGAIGDADMDGG